MRSTVVLVVALAVGGCADDPVAAPTTTTRPLDATTTTVAPDPDQAAVLDAYVTSWEAFSEFVNGDPPGEPADYYEGDHLANVVARIAEYAEEGLELRGAADLAPHDVEVVGAAASLGDCQIDRTYAVERTTGAVVIPAGDRAQEVTVELVRVGGRWKVSSVDYGAEGSCQR